MFIRQAGSISRDEESGKKQERKSSQAEFLLRFTQDTEVGDVAERHVTGYFDISLRLIDQQFESVFRNGAVGADHRCGGVVRRVGVFQFRFGLGHENFYSFLAVIPMNRLALIKPLIVLFV